MKKVSLKWQLVLVTIVAVALSLLFIVLILPNLLKPFYEKNIYEILEQPFQYIQEKDQKITGGTAYLVCDFTGSIYVSNNFNKILKNVDIDTVVNSITSAYGKFKINKNNFYYNTNLYNGQYFVTICDDSYIIEQENSLNKIVIPSIFIVAVIIIAILLIYSNFIVKKISKIKDKIDNIDNDKYNHNEKFEIDDELNSLVNSIEKTRNSLKEKENYKNKMFQTMSHELKTPIMVISSYIEAINDDVVDKDTALTTIKNETENLNNRVGLMLQLNKINYLKSTENFEVKNILTNDLKNLITKQVERLKIIRPDITFNIDVEGEFSFKGDEENWNIIFNNILTNFIRYANTSININVKKDEIELENDGKQIEEGFLSEIFDTYTMGDKGKTGLGLAIVKQTLELFGYSIEAKNIENGVKFVIK